MSPSNKRPFPRLALLSRMAVCLTIIGMAILTVLLGHYWYLRDDLSDLPYTWLLLPSPPLKIKPLEPEEKWAKLGTWPGTRRPRTRPAEGAELSEEAEVIGVCINGQSRAYALLSLDGAPHRHVVNDVLGGRAVSVVYCDRRNCARAYTSDTDEPLPINVGGWHPDAGMMLKLGDTNYALETGANLIDPNGEPFPYQPMPFLLTTWSQWCRLHPDTDIYLNYSMRAVSSQQPGLH
jgi:hypothetical protein